MRDVFYDSSANPVRNLNNILSVLQVAMSHIAQLTLCAICVCKQYILDQYTVNWFFLSRTIFLPSSFLEYGK